MMAQETIFAISNSLALFSWIVLLIFPFKQATNQILIGISIALLSVAYAVLVFQTLSPADMQQFSTLSGVESLMATPGAALVGWIHYLAFDLLAGLFIANNAAKNGIGHAAIFPCLMCTFMLGPFGLLLYLIIRLAITRQWFQPNF